MRPPGHRRKAGLERAEDCFAVEPVIADRIYAVAYSHPHAGYRASCLEVIDHLGGPPSHSEGFAHTDCPLRGIDLVSPREPLQRPGAGAGGPERPRPGGKGPRPLAHRAEEWDERDSVECHRYGIDPAGAGQGDDA